MLNCKECPDNSRIDREECQKCLDEEENKYLSEKNWDADVCYSCWNLFKEVKWACEWCIFETLKK